MNMIYSNETLYVDIFDNDELFNIEHIKRQVFSVLSQYEIPNVVVNLDGGSFYNKESINSLIRDYHRLYKGNLIIDIK